jgi:hypothetical protein
MKSYRQIYKEHYGEIPTDSNGITFDIHHIDGNRRNNNISNLKAISVKEHYEIHKSQGDWGACLLLSNRLNLTLEEKLEINKKYSGENHPCKRPEVIEKIKIANIGKKYSNEVNKKKGSIGDKNPMKRSEVDDKVSKAKLGKKRPEISGEKHPRYKRGSVIQGAKNGRAIKIEKIDSFGNLVKLYDTMIDAYKDNNIDFVFSRFTILCKLEKPINEFIYKRIK